MILDFTRGADHISLAAIDSNTLVAGNQAFTFIGAAGFSHHAGELSFSGGLLQGDVNGDGIPDLQIGVPGVTALSGADFIL